MFNIYGNNDIPKGVYLGAGHKVDVEEGNYHLTECKIELYVPDDGLSDDNENDSNQSEYNRLLYKWEPSDGIISTDVTYTKLTTTYINQQDMPKTARVVVTAPDGKNVLDEI